LQALRRARAVLRSAHWWQGADAEHGVVARWYLPEGASPSAQDWNNPARRALALQLTHTPRPGSAKSTDPLNASCLLLFNGAAHPVRFVLPPGDWFLHIDNQYGNGLNRRLDSADGAQTLPRGSLWLASTVPIENL
jgi:glycogen operon protein